MSGTDFTTPFVEGFAQLLAAAGIGLAWQASGPYPEDGTTGIFVMNVPQTPDQLVALTPYGLPAPNESQAMSQIGLQVRIRSATADPRPLFSLDDAISDVLLGNYPLTLPTGVRLSTLEFTGSTPLEQDTNQRWNWSSNYRAVVYRPTSHRR